MSKKYDSLTKKVKEMEEMNKSLKKKIEQLIEQENIVEVKSENKNSLEASRSSLHVSTTSSALSCEETPSSMMYDQTKEEKLEMSDRKMTSILEQNPSNAKVIENQLLQHENQLSQHEKILEQLSMIICSINGEYLWRISEINTKSSQSIYIDSPPFYTGINGYKMSIRAYFYSYDNGNHKHLSISFFLMKGDYDPLLQWPFKSTVSLILIDQDNRNKDYVKTIKPDPQSCSFQKPTTDVNVPSGCAEFPELSVLESTSHVKDDVMYIKAVVHTNT